jgi:thiamine biosynthesis lipoprotein
MAMKLDARRLGWIVLTLGLLIVAGACERGADQKADVPDAAAKLVTEKASRTVMGTFAELTAVAADSETARVALEAGYDRLEDVNRLMSDYVDDSEIGRLNRAPVGESVSLSPETLRCIELAMKVQRASGGAFDVTCRPLVQLWRGAAEAGQLPTDAEVAHVLEAVGPDVLAIESQEHSAWRLHEAAQVDLGGVAKGYGLDLAAEAMLAAGATSVLVNVGGDVRAVGQTAEGRPWQVGVKHPFDQALIRVVALRDEAVATSGLQQRYFEIDGRRYSHIVDPRTGRPAAQAPSVTVIAANGATADAWATALSVLSIEEGKGLIDSGKTPPLEVLWIAGSKEQPTMEMTAGFRAHLVE